MNCRRVGCPGIVPAQRVEIGYCCEICRALASKHRAELQRLAQAEAAGKTARAEQLRSGIAGLAAVAEAVSAWRGALGGTAQ